jgi:hypothetical protein
LRDAPVGVFCANHLPADAEISSAITFANSEVGQLTKLIVAVDGTGSRSESKSFPVPVEFRFRSELLDSLVNFDAYRTDIKHRYEVAEIAEGYSLTLQDVYVPPAGYTLKDHHRIEFPDIEEHTLSWTTETSLRHIALLGEYGEGKSVLALRITYRMLFGTTPSARTPILIPLGGRSPRTHNKLSLLAEWAAQYSINPLALLTLHDAGRLLLIFDAFDEMDLVGEPALRFDHFRTLWAYSSDPGAKIMITGRPNFFLDELEREAALNIRSASAEVPYMYAVYLSRFTIGQIASALRNFPETVREEITTYLGSSHTPESFRDLISRPSTLFLAANIWQELSKRVTFRGSRVRKSYRNSWTIAMKDKEGKSRLGFYRRLSESISMPVSPLRCSEKHGFQIISMLLGFRRRSPFCLPHSPKS